MQVGGRARESPETGDPVWATKTVCCTIQFSLNYTEAMVTHWKIVTVLVRRTLNQSSVSLNFSSLFHSSSSLGAWSFTVHFLNYYYLPDAKPKLGYETLSKGPGKSSQHLERLIWIIVVTFIKWPEWRNGFVKRTLIDDEETIPKFLNCLWIVLIDVYQLKWCQLLKTLMELFQADAVS